MEESIADHPAEAVALAWNLGGKWVGAGSGGPGFMQGDVAIDLEEQNGKTLLKYSTDAKIGGLIASIGQRMLNGVSKMMVDQFFKKIETFI